MVRVYKYITIDFEEQNTYDGGQDDRNHNYQFPMIK